ncbi:helix-turn-helix domain-containing protein [Halobacillus mangrovi]|uniref:helix-turn-helix domain-containing protein n=1 Tax=Halobacillus mangrovi TaxID=402384 RepID=UPI0018DEBACC|nr:helix-turn-helix domain-containing protein [Halobacillus mangrovi]
MFNQIILDCVHRLKGERTISGIYNLLTGKRSAQTLQDARVYKLDSYFGIYKSLDREQLKHSFQRLEEKEWLVIKGDIYSSITSKGYQYLSNHKETLYFNGLMDHAKVAEFERRIFLLIQTFTNMLKGKRSFIPIVEDAKAQLWVKKVYQKNHNDLAGIVKSLYNEIYTLLKDRPALEAEIFTYRLTGGGVIGLTREQLKDKHNISLSDVDVYLNHVFYYLFFQANQSSKTNSVLSLCAKGLKESSLITASAKRTYAYIEKGWSIDEIVRKRRLKKSTIQDHIVEAALVVPFFPIDSFLSEHELHKIINVANELDTQRLKLIYENLEGQFTYFQLRLALAKDQISSEEGTLYANA